jgi:hypothetical protein
MRFPDPRRLELGSESDNKQHWKACHALNRHIQQFA